MSIRELYEPLIERNLEAIPAAVRAFRAEHSSDDLFLAVARFAVLAYAPSQHAKRALLACLSAYDVRELVGDDYDALLTECAIYTAASRQPWSEPPITDPPPLEESQRGDVDELREAIAASDRLRAERWLAKRFEDDGNDRSPLPAARGEGTGGEGRPASLKTQDIDPSESPSPLRPSPRAAGRGDRGSSTLAQDLFTVAADDFSDLGHKLIIANAAWRLAPILGEQGRFATLRTAIWEMVAYDEARYEEQGVAPDVSTLMGRLIDAYAFEEGSITSAHAIFLLDAAISCGEAGVLRRTRDYLANYTNAASAARDFGPAPPKPPVYRLARDYGACLKAYAVAHRRAKELPGVNFSRMVAAANHNRLNGASFEDWAFA